MRDEIYGNRVVDDSGKKAIEIRIRRTSDKGDDRVLLTVPVGGKSISAEIASENKAMQDILSISYRLQCQSRTKIEGKYELSVYDKHA